MAEFYMPFCLPHVYNNNTLCGKAKRCPLLKIENKVMKGPWCLSMYLCGKFGHLLKKIESKVTSSEVTFQMQ